MFPCSSILYNYAHRKLKVIFSTRYYRKAAYFSTILTGFSALAAQIVWQKYLAILVGSESRSVTLVVSVFLCGLAGGYYVFGLLTERKQWSRHLLLKFYGYVELATALYIGLFFIYFEFLKIISFNSPPYFIIDVVVSLLAILIPTFLMGASIPILTAAIPDHSLEINTVHAQVYGWNTLGACFGVLLSGFVMVPLIGLAGTLVIAATLNLLAALVFMKNPLKGQVKKQKQPDIVPSALSNRFYIAFTFLTGAIIISFEILLVRILHISLGGARVYNFPIILTLFVGGLALGSLSISKQKISVKYFIHQLFMVIFLLSILFWITAYWPLWLDLIRSHMGFLSSDYIVFLLLVFAVLFICLFPVVFCLGKLLPIVYALLKKNRENYGRVCGYLYFFNTLGTVFGAIGIGYLAFYIFDLDDLFKINIGILVFLTLIVAFYEKYIRSMVVLSIFGLCVMLLPLGWDHTEYYPMYSQNKSGTLVGYYLKSWWFFPSYEKSRVRLFKNDGPNTTVDVTGRFFNKEDPETKFHLNPLFPFKLKTYQSYGLVTNGKGDGETLVEFSTYFLISALSYLFAPDKGNLSSAVIGLGTGVTTGVLGSLDPIKDIKVLEISPTVIKGIRHAPSHLNFGVFQNPKIDILETDAFKYFTKVRKKFDIIVSQPSNIWVTGVENLFSKEFYQLASQSLSEGGVLGQWFQHYNINWKILKMIMRTLKNVFPYTELYEVGHRDLFILASLKPLNRRIPYERFFHPFLYKFFRSLGMNNKEDIYLTRMFNNDQYEQITALPLIDGSHFNINRKIHSITKPRLSYLSDKTSFLLRNSEPFDITSELITHSDEGKRMIAFHQYKNQPSNIWNNKCVKLRGYSFFCKSMYEIMQKYHGLKNTAQTGPVQLRNYAFLRDRNLIRHNERFLDNVFSTILKNQHLPEDTCLIYVQQRMKNKDFKIAYSHINILKERKLINKKQYEETKAYIDRMKKIYHFINWSY